MCNVIAYKFLNEKPDELTVSIKTRLFKWVDVYQLLPVPSE